MHKACSPVVIKHVCLADTGINATSSKFYWFFDDNENCDVNFNHL